MRRYGHLLICLLGITLIPAARPQTSGEVPTVSLVHTNLVVDRLGRVLERDGVPSAQPNPSPEWSLVVRVTLVPPGPQVTNATLALVGGTAVAGRDFAFLSPQGPNAGLTSAPFHFNGPEGGILFLSLLGDAPRGGPRTMHLQLRGSAAVRVGSSSNLWITLVDPPALVSASFQTDAGDALLEARGGTGVFRVERTGDTNVAVTVDYTVTDPRPLWMGQEPQVVPGRLVLSAGQRLAEVRVAVTNDAVVNPGALEFRITGVSPGAIFPEPWWDSSRRGVAQVEVIDDEEPPNLDPTFAPRIRGGGIVEAFEQSDGRLVVAGTFREVDGTPVPGLARLHPDGSLDASFRPAISEIPSMSYPRVRLGLLRDGAIAVAWWERREEGEGSRLSILLPDGSADPSFRPSEALREEWARSGLSNPGEGPFVALPDGGFLASVGGSVLNIHRDGTMEWTDLPEGNGLRAAVGRDGSVVVVTDGYYLLKRRADGTYDGGFERAATEALSSFGSSVGAITIDAEDRFWVGLHSSDGPLKHTLVRLLPDGRLDPAFPPRAIGVHSFAQRGTEIWGLGWDPRLSSQPVARILFRWDTTGREVVRQPVTVFGSGSKLVSRSGDRAVVLGLQTSILGWNSPFFALRTGPLAPTQVNAFPAPETEIATPSWGSYLRSRFARVEYFENEGSIQVSFRRAGPTTGPASVGWRTRDRSAKSGSDFLGVTGGRVDFAPLEVEKQVSIPIVADSEAEGVEFFDIEITDAEGIAEAGPPLRLWLGELRLKVPEVKQGTALTGDRLEVEIENPFFRIPTSDLRLSGNASWNPWFEISEDQGNWGAAFWEWQDYESGRFGLYLPPRPGPMRRSVFVRGVMGAPWQRYLD
jgi:hypothetical protein